MQHPQPPQHRKKLRGFFPLLAQGTCPCIGVFHLGGRRAFDDLQGGGQGDLQGDFSLGALRHVWQSREQF